MADLVPLWHCPRPKLARAYLAQLGAGVITSTSVFAPRRTGKTIFLLNDLKPAAEKAGYRVAYVDLWQTKLRPALAIIRGLEECLQPKGLGEKVAAKLHEPVKKFKLKGEVGELKGEAELEFADEKIAASEAGLRIDELIGKLVAKGPLLLLVDEAQELAKTEANEDVAKSLRTALTKHREKVRVVYTGSNRSRLAHMFSDSEAPLYSPGLGVIDFPLLGGELVEFAAKKFATATGGTRALNVEVGVRVLTSLQHRPEPFLKAVMHMLASPGITLEDAAAAADRASENKDDYEGTWKSLTAIQRELLKLSVQDDFKPFGAETVESIRVALGLDKMARTNVQRAMSGLQERSILAKSPRGVYEFDDHLFKRWMVRHIE